MAQLSISTWLLETSQLWLYGTLLAKWSLLFNLLSRFVIAVPPRSKCLVISWLQSLSTVILKPNKRKSLLVSNPPLLFVMKWWNKMTWSLFFECWVLSQVFHSLSPSSRGSLVLFHFLPLRWCHLHNWDYISPGNLVSNLCFIQPGILHDVLCI